ncbi:MAG: GNAT family N-acetyltransferase [Myxococcales bacterium]|nr:GNAT family N-acetyltransferase [Myxococcales bacterium]MCB9580077.1 GNAT family N-acetyltransferase [Polyangiaceae bacterium]
MEMEREPGTLETDHVEVRSLRSDDLDWIVRIDEKHAGRNRREYYKVKLAESEKDTGVRISLAALVDGEPAGFMMGRLYYGEFGVPEPVAILDSVGVAPAYVNQHVARALLRQLEMNLAALGIERLETQVSWDQLELIRFFQRSGFKPAARLSLEKPVAHP